MLILALFRAVFFRWGSPTTLHDPFSAIFALGDILLGGEALAGLFGAGEAAAGIGAGEAAAAGIGAGEAAAGGAFTGDLLAGGGLLGAGELAGSAASTIPEAISLGGAGAGAAGAGALDLGAGALDFAGAGSGGLDLALGGGSSGIIPGAVPAGSVPGIEGVTPLANLANPAVPASAASPVGASALPSAAASAVPSSIGELSPAATGTFTNTFEAGPGTSVLSFDPATGATTAGGVGDASSASSAGGGLTSGFDKAIGSITGGALNSKDLGLAASLGGLGMNLLKGNQPIPGEAQTRNAANSLAATAGAQANKGQQLESFVNTGTLPPGLSDGLKTATAAAEAQIRSGYANRGMSGSSAEQQDIAAAHERAHNAAAQIALQLLSQGSAMVGQAVNTEGLAAQIYQAISRDALAQDQALGSAIGNFAGALAGAGGGGAGTITLKAA